MACPPVFVSQARLDEQPAVNRKDWVRSPGGTLLAVVVLVGEPPFRNRVRVVQLHSTAPRSRAGSCSRTVSGRTWKVQTMVVNRPRKPALRTNRKGFDFSTFRRWKMSRSGTGPAWKAVRARKGIHVGYELLRQFYT